jgi:hypothetical protein
MVRVEEVNQKIRRKSKKNQSTKVKRRRINKKQKNNKMIHQDSKLNLMNNIRLKCPHLIRAPTETDKITTTLAVTNIKETTETIETIMVDSEIEIGITMIMDIGEEEEVGEIGATETETTTGIIIDKVGTTIGVLIMITTKKDKTIRWGEDVILMIITEGIVTFKTEAIGVTEVTEVVEEAGVGEVEEEEVLETTSIRTGMMVKIKRTTIRVGDLKTKTLAITRIKLKFQMNTDIIVT